MLKESSDLFGKFLNENALQIAQSVGAMLALLVTIFVIIRVRGRVVASVNDTPTEYKQKRRLLSHFHRIAQVVNFYLAGALVVVMLKFWYEPGYKWVAKNIFDKIEFITKQLITIAVFVGMWELCYYFLRRRLIQRNDTYTARARTLFPILINTVMIIFTVMYGFMLLSALGVDIAPLLTGAGVAGIAVGLGAQKSIQDVISGFTIIFEDLIQVGDVVKIGTHGGSVEAITLRKIQLRDFNGSVYTIPYSQVTIIENMTKDFSFYVFDIRVGYKADLQKVFAAINHVDEEIRKDPAFANLILAPVEVSGVDTFQDYAILIKARIKTPPSKQWAIGREFNRLLKNEFDAQKIPFPQRSVRIKEEEKEKTEDAAAEADAQIQKSNENKKTPAKHAGAA